MALLTIIVRSPQLSNHLNLRVFIQVPLTMVRFLILIFWYKQCQIERFRNIFYCINHNWLQSLLLAIGNGIGSLKSYENKTLNDDQRSEILLNQIQEKSKHSSRTLQPIRSNKLGKENRYSSEESMLEGKFIYFLFFTSIDIKVLFNMLSEYKRCSQYS